MPYDIKKSGSGFKVCKKAGGKCFSKKPLSKQKAKAQMAAIYANESINNSNGVIMRSYEQLFRKTLLSEDDMGMQQVPGEQQAPNEQPISDEDAWAQSNPEITGNEELQGPFNVEGLDKAEIEKYSEIIAQWGEGIDAAIKQLAQIVKFAAGEKLENAPGSEQFSSLIKDAPRLKSDLSAFKSQVEDLAETVKLAINDAAQERKEKIKSLQ